MKSPATLSREMPRHDYSPALQNAVSWLGDRYLLAEPVRRVNEPKPYFAEVRGWHPRSRGNA